MCSMEQLQNVRKRKAGRILGRLPSKTTIWERFYEASRYDLAHTLLKDFSRHQIRSGLVGLWFWFTDSHMLSYTGQEKVHYSYSTQRRIPVPGRTNRVTCDASGQIVGFVIEEGKGEMKQQIPGMIDQWPPELPAHPIAVFDHQAGCSEPGTGA